MSSLCFLAIPDYQEKIWSPRFIALLHLLVDMWCPAMLKLSAKTGPFNLRSISSEDLLMNIDGIVFTSRRCALVKTNQV